MLDMLKILRATFNLYRLNIKVKCSTFKYCIVNNDNRELGGFHI